MNSSIEYVSVEKQIEKLKSQGLIIPDEHAAKVYLEIFGYSNLIKSYRDPYVISAEDNKKKYRSGVSISQILSLYSFDKNLRNAVMASMLDLEEHIKEIAATVVSRSFGTKPEEYLLFHNYRDKKRSKEQFTLGYILNKFQKSLHSGKDPIKHYRLKYNSVPPWILFKSAYFSTIVNFIKLFKSKEQLFAAEYLYDNTKLNLPNDSLKKLMMDTLFLCNEYRNLAAHGGRTYNYEYYSNIRINEIWTSDISVNISGINGLLYLLSLLRYRNPYDNLKKALDYGINKHCSIFPQDITYLGQILNVDLVSKSIVYINNSSYKFHKYPHCSGMRLPIRMDFEDAVANGYTQCKICFKP